MQVFSLFIAIKILFIVIVVIICFYLVRLHEGAIVFCFFFLLNHCFKSKFYQRNGYFFVVLFVRETIEHIMIEQYFFLFQ